MPKFFVTARTEQGKPHSSVVDAVDKNSAVNIVQSQGLFVISAQLLEDIRKGSAGQTSSGKVKKFTHSGIRLQDVVVFAKQLGTMIEAGVPLLKSLTVIADQVDSQKFSVVLEQVKMDVEQGQTFSKALAKHPQIFGQFWVCLVEVGEASGTMPQVLKKLTEYMEDVEKFRSQIIGSMIYPCVLLTVCCCAILAFALFIGPTFKKIFHDMGMPLPGITQFMLAFFDFLKTKFLFIIGGIAGTVLFFRSYIKTSAGRWQFESTLYKLPILGPIVRLIVIEKFTSQMSVLVESGVPILYALEISERLVDNVVCGAVIKSIREAVKEGKLLADPMEKSGFFPAMTVQMIRVGEETGELAKMLGHVAKYYKSQVEEFMRRISTIIEPVMLVFMGGIMGTMVVSMFLPILTLSTGG
jgi:type IV pilus assembly protein PilC